MKVPAQPVPIADPVIAYAERVIADAKKKTPMTDPTPSVSEAISRVRDAAYPIAALDRTRASITRLPLRIVIDYLDALQRELAEARAGMTRRGDDMIVPMHLLDEINASGYAWKQRAEAAEAQLSDARRDAERYRWLRRRMIAAEVRDLARDCEGPDDFVAAVNSTPQSTLQWRPHMTDFGPKPFGVADGTVHSMPMRFGVNDGGYVSLSVPSNIKPEYVAFLREVLELQLGVIARLAEKNYPEPAHEG